MGTDSKRIKEDVLQRIMKFPQNSIILQEGEVNLDMYKIIQGHAEMYTRYGTDKEVLLGIIGPQSCFGEFGLLLQKPAIYTVVAYEDVYALRVTEGDMGDFVRENHKSVIDIMRNMANTMLLLQQQVDMLSEELQNNYRSEIEKKKTSSESTTPLQVKRALREYAVYRPDNLRRYLGPPSDLYKT